MQIDYKQWMLKLSDVSSALMQARTLSELLSTILFKTRELTHSDAGSVYRIKRDTEVPKLIFEQAQNDSVDIPKEQFTLPMDRSSLAGWVAVEGEVLNISDVYDLPEDRPYTFDGDMDDSLGYRTQSILVIPLKNREGTVRGVLQLINRKSDPERPIDETTIEEYPESLIEVVQSFSNQAAVAIERAELDESIQSMIHSMIQALVNALDKRDKITTGHSRRVAGYGYHLARAINASNDPEWNENQLGEDDLRRLYYAGLLHDIGKIAVPETVLNKQDRLSEDTMKAVYYRLAYLQETGQIEGASSVFEQIQEINQSGYLESDQESFLEDLRGDDFIGPDGEPIAILSDYEFEHLSVKRGNLTEEERNLIESHARATYDILEQISWTDELDNVPGIAAAHHERLDGSGYPAGKTKEELPLLARILAIVDVYEALTARDRPYRSAMDHPRARDVLLEESENGNLDSSLVELFLEEDVYDKSVEELPDFELG
jgi:HD-GYP domain-containing protein (c-di-GMP phosphodiesterase class II)